MILLWICLPDMRGFMTAHGQPDQPRSARYVLKDYVSVSASYIWIFFPDRRWIEGAGGSTVKLILFNWIKLTYIKILYNFAVVFFPLWVSLLGFFFFFCNNCILLLYRGSCYIAIHLLALTQMIFSTSIKDAQRAEPCRLLDKWSLRRIPKQNKLKMWWTKHSSTR